jgi:anthranilate synthase component 2
MTVTKPPRVVIVDHYDSFSYNLLHALARGGAACEVVAHDRVTVDQLVRADGLVLSAGPCSPRETGVSLPLVRALAANEGPPLLGICLGHQCIAAALGGSVATSRAAMHGKTALVHHDGRRLFAKLPSPMAFARYNSLTVTEPLPGELEACAWDERGEIMALRHRHRPIDGVQFHPESHLSFAEELFASWLETLTSRPAIGPTATRPVPR